ncbi:carboxylate--amine ligase [Natronomonas salina]|uniref:carboxylate--amine ligase n=1 Tax=Natronomonas salina TaxID=1710540 RepID=UPI0015B75886|nr:carboxylate--amine ligase [Natronomonas salina]QLD89269.1 carboxylate--amine ligase [Natronomonas salina]
MVPAPTPGGSAIPATGTASSTAAIRSLGREGVRTLAFSELESPPGFASQYCDETTEVPDPTEDLTGYENALLELARRPDVDTVLPFREPDVYVLARNRGALAAHVGTPWPDLETLRRVQDRKLLFEAADRADVPAPVTRTLDEWPVRDGDVVVKPRYTVHAAEYADRFPVSHTQWSTTRYVSPEDRLDHEALTEAMGHVPLVQEFVPSTDEYGFFALFDRGEAVATFQHRQRRGWKYCGGPSAYRESVDIPELEAAGLRLLEELDWHGVAMVEFLRDPETGEFELMEVNPRFWLSLPFTIQAGVDFPALYWRQATGRPVESAPEYDVGVAGHLLRGEALHLHSVLADDYPLVDRPSFARTALSVAGSLLRHPRFDYLSARDPAPFVRDLVETYRIYADDSEPDTAEVPSRAPGASEGPTAKEPSEFATVGAESDD